MRVQTLANLMLGLVVLGIVVPFSAVALFLLDHGPDLPELLDQAVANRISVFAWLDVIVSALVVAVAALSRRFVSTTEGVWSVVFTCALGVSAGLPLFLYFVLRREASTAP